MNNPILLLQSILHMADKCGFGNYVPVRMEIKKKLTAPESVNVKSKIVHLVSILASVMEVC